mgnify:FL=1
MRKNIKKIILVLCIILSVVGIVLTIIYAKNNIKNSFDSLLQLSNQNNQSFIPMNKNSIKLTPLYVVLIGTFCTIFSLCIVYLIMSIKNEKFYKIKDKIIIYILSNIVVIGYMLSTITIITNNFILNDKKIEQQTTKDKVTLDESNSVAESTIDLNNPSTDVTITKGGTYTFSGSFKHSIIVDAENENVEIVLNGVNITTENTATIIGLNANKITITLNENTTNVLTDGGNSEYDGCIYSNAELIFNGNGTLIVNGNQNDGEGIATEAKNITFNSGTYKITSIDDGINAGGDGATITINDGTFYIDASGDGIDSNKDAIINGGIIFVMGSDVGGDSGIDTDDGYTINGGFVVALGSDMIETPNNTSKQNTLAFTLDNTISKDTIVTLMKDEEVIVSFKSTKNFKTIIISTEYLTNGNYTLYTGGSNTGVLSNGIYKGGTYTKGNIVSVNNYESFSVNKTVNTYGTKGDR